MECESCAVCGGVYEDGECGGEGKVLGDWVGAGAFWVDGVGGEGGMGFCEAVGGRMGVWRGGVLERGNSVWESLGG